MMNNWQSVDSDDWNLGALGCLEPGDLDFGDLEPGKQEECRIRAFFAQVRFIIVLAAGRHKSLLSCWS